MLDRAKAFPLLKEQQPESVADVDFTTYDGKPLVSDFNDYEIQIEQAFRFNAEDTLVFRVAITNKMNAPWFICRTVSRCARATGSTRNPSATPEATCRPKAGASFISP